MGLAAREEDRLAPPRPYGRSPSTVISARPSSTITSASWGVVCSLSPSPTVEGEQGHRARAVLHELPAHHRAVLVVDQVVEPDDLTAAYARHCSSLRSGLQDTDVRQALGARHQGSLTPRGRAPRVAPCSRPRPPGPSSSRPRWRPASDAAPPPDASGGPAQETGRALAEELGCGGCHAGMPAPDVVRRRAPALGVEAAALSPRSSSSRTWATRFDDATTSVHRACPTSASTRPNASPSPSSSARRRPSTAGALRRSPRASSESGRRPRPTHLRRPRLCAGCHAGVEGAGAHRRTRPVPGGRRASRRDWLAGFVARPASVRGDGHPTLAGARMPDFRLTEGEAAALSAYLRGPGPALRHAGHDGAHPLRGRPHPPAARGPSGVPGVPPRPGQGGRIGPSLDGLAGRLEPSFVLEMILDPQRAAPGSPMPRQPMPPREAARLARYLLGLGGTRRAADARVAGRPGPPGMDDAGGHHARARGSTRDTAPPATERGAGVTVGTPRTSPCPRPHTPTRPACRRAPTTRCSTGSGRARGCWTAARACRPSAGC